MGVKLKNGEYWIDYRVGNKRIRTKIGPNKTLALNALRKRMVEIAEGKHLDIQKEKRIKFADFARTYLENHCKVNNKSWKTDRTFLSPANPTSLVSQFGKYALQEITPLLIEEFKRCRIESVRPSTVNRALEILSSLFNKAVGEGLLRDNPMKRVKKFRLENKRLRYLERGELRALLEHSGPRLKPIVLLAINTGLRKREIQKLKWQHVDLERNQICILDQKNGDKSYLPINTQARAALTRAKELAKDSPFVFCKEKSEEPYDCRQAFETAMKRAQITDADFHTLRHTFASYLVMAGVPLNTVRELMRHKSLAMTLRYAHLSKDYKDTAIEALSGQMDGLCDFNSQIAKQKESAIILNGMDTIWTPRHSGQSKRTSATLVSPSKSLS